jgi:hypothetical protein
VALRQPFDAYFGLKEGLEGLLGRTVDLVVACTIKNPYRKASIEQDRGTVMRRDARAYLWDAVKAAEAVQTFIRSRSYDWCNIDVRWRQTILADRVALTAATSSRRRTCQWNWKGDALAARCGTD